jgi:hypothetical protein
MRPLLIATCLVPLVMVGCGGDDDPRASRTLPSVELVVESPVDMDVVREEQVTVQGTVVPARADVQVLGRAAEVTGGRFTITVPLEPGANVIDVIASARGREPAMTAFRVTREVPVEVPDLHGLDADQVESALGDVGLRANIEEENDLLDDILGGEPQVCTQDPEPGTQVRRGTTVHVIVSKGC